MLSPVQLATYAAVCETGTFELAAARVGVTPSAVSQRMRALAETAGGALFERLAPAHPTALGRRLLRHANEITALEAALMEEIGRAAGPRPIRLAINADSLETWAVDALAKVEGFRFDVVIEDQDHAAALLRQGEVSAAVTASGDPVPGCDAKPLGALRYRAVCAPQFRERWFPQGPTAKAFEKAPVLQFNAKDALQSRWASHVAGRPVALPAPHLLSATSPFQLALCSGLGWGLNPEPLLAADLAAGRLVDLEPVQPLDTPLDLQVSRSMANVIAPVALALRRAAREVLRQR